MKAWRLILLGVVLLGWPAAIQAQFTYTTNNGTISITGYAGTNSDVVIPDTITGLPVTSISYFYSGSYSSSGLVTITIPASVTNIASGVFEAQGNLTGILVSEQNAVYSSSNGVLFDKPETVLIEAPGGITGSYAIPAGVTSIGNSAFSSCYKLSVITIPDSVTNIGTQAFNGCLELTQVAIGPNILNIGAGAFGNCPNLVAIVVDALNAQYSSVNGVLFDKLEQTLIQAPGGKAGSYAIPDGVASIGSAAFQSCSRLTGITVPNSVTNIGGEAFAVCSLLTSLQLGSNVVSIGDSAFASCTSLTNLTIPDSVTDLGNEVFFYCRLLANVTLGTNVSSITPQAFYGCTDLAELSVPNSVTNIGSSALANCSGLTNIVLGTNVGSIADGALENCSRLTGIDIPASLTNIGDGVFAGCGSLTAITVDAQNPAYASSDGILYNKFLTTLVQVPGGFNGSYALPDSVTTIGNAALAGCVNLTAITAGPQNGYFIALDGVLFNKLQTTLVQFPGGIGGSYIVPDGITSLGGYAFSGCSNLVSITIPASITNVGPSTFANCAQAGIYFQGTAPHITPSGFGGIVSIQLLSGLGGSSYNPHLEAAYYLPGTTGWSNLFDGLKAYLWVPPYVCTPASNSITINGYNGSGSTVTIPDTIEGLPVTAIGDGAFDNAAGPGVTNIVLGVNLVTIGNYAFAACDNLTSIRIPAGVTNLGNDAFAFCDNLESVYFQGNAPATGSGVFFEWGGVLFPYPVYEPPTPTTVYYLPGTTGWGTTFAGQPAVLWNPQAQTGDASFGPRADGFAFNITGATNLTVVVEASTNLASADWQPVETLTLTNGLANFCDPQWTNYPGRFYRFRSP